MIRCWTLVPVVMGVIGVCGNTFAQQSSAVPPQPLSAEQRTTALEAFQSGTIASSAANAFNPDMVSGIPGQDAASLKWVQMTGLLRTAIQSGACRIQDQQSIDPNTGAVARHLFRLSGSACPIAYSDLDQDNNQTGSSSSTEVYQVNDPSYAALNDVDSSTLNTEASLTPAPGNVLDFSIQGGGSIHSRSLGIIPVTISGTGTASFPQNASTMEILIEARFPAFSAILREELQSQGNFSLTTYYLNDVELTPDEVKTYIDMPFVPQPKQPQAPFSLDLAF